MASSVFMNAGGVGTVIAVPITLGPLAITSTLVTSTVPIVAPGAPLNVMAYGATGDGTTDDTTAVQACLDAARTGGLPVFVPTGQYKITSTLTWHTTADNVQAPIIIGDGQFNTIFKSAVASGPLLSIKSTTTLTFARGGYLGDFSITASGTPIASDGILIQAIYQTEIERVRITSISGDGMRIIVASGDADGSVMLNIHDNWISGVGGIGLDVETTGAAVELSFANIIRNFVTGCPGGGIRYKGLNGVIHDNAITLNSTFGLRIAYSGSNNRTLSVCRNTFEHNSGILLDIEALTSGVFELNEFVNTSSGYTPTALVSFGSASGSVTDVVFRYNNVRVTYALYGSLPGFPVGAGAPQNITIESTRWEAGYDAGQNTRFNLSSAVQVNVIDDAVTVYGSTITTGASAGDVVFRNDRSLRGITSSSVLAAIAKVNTSDEVEFGSSTLRNTLAGPRTNVVGRFNFKKGANVTAANDLTLGSDGNVFHITGNTQINAITTSQWQGGAEIMVIFDGTPTVKNATAGGAGTASLKLAGAADFVATADDTLTLVYDGTSWYEKCRAVI